MKATLGSLVIVTWLISPSAVFGADRFLNCTKATPGDGNSASTAWNTMAEAINEASPGDVVSVTAGPCRVSSLVFGPGLSGSGDCQTAAAGCTIFRGSGVISVQPSGAATPDGLLIGAGVKHLRLENFKFDPHPTFGVFSDIAMTIRPGGGMEDVVLSNVSVEGAHGGDSRRW